VQRPGIGREARGSPAAWTPRPADPVALRRQQEERSAFLFGALLVYLIGMLVRIAGFAFPLHAIVFSLLVDSFVLLLVLANRHLVAHLQVVLRGPALLAAIAAAALASAGVTVLFARSLVLLVVSGPPRWLPAAGPQFVYFAYVFLAWAVAGRWLEARAQAHEDQLRAITAENAAIVAEMQQLRTQLDPHFLFNALNMMAVDIHDRPKHALKLLRELSQYLRYSLDTADRPFVPVALEVAGMRSFLRVQQSRFGARLRSRVTVEGSMRGRLLPPFLMQPLVENATKHGIPGADGVLSVDVTVTAEDDRVVITVRNDGDLAALPQRDGTGTGLSNLEKRLRLHYPDRHGFDLRQEGDQVVARLRLEGPPC